MHISAKDLAQMASAVDEKHHEAMKTFREETGDIHLDSLNLRRSFMKKAGVGGLALAATPALLPAASLLSRASAAKGITDVDIAVYAESVELAAVAIYGAAAGLLSAGVKPVGELFAKHHKDHAAAFASLAGSKATGKPNAKLVDIFSKQLAPTLKTEADALNLAMVVENQAAATYAFALTALTVEGAYKGTATILPIESEHATIIGMALGKNPADLFPNGAFEGATVGAIGDPKVGLDPALYPVA